MAFDGIGQNRIGSEEAQGVLDEIRGAPVDAWSLVAFDVSPKTNALNVDPTIIIAVTGQTVQGVAAVEPVQAATSSFKPA